MAPLVDLSAHRHLRWRFVGACFDEASLVLTVDGQAVELERRPLELLGLLLAHAGEVVTKDEIFDTIWPGREVTEASLTKCMARLRQGLGDTRNIVSAPCMAMATGSRRRSPWRRPRRLPRSPRQRPRLRRAMRCRCGRTGGWWNGWAAVVMATPGLASSPRPMSGACSNSRTMPLGSRRCAGRLRSHGCCARDWGRGPTWSASWTGISRNRRRLSKRRGANWGIWRTGRPRRAVPPRCRWRCGWTSRRRSRRRCPPFMAWPCCTRI